MRFYILYNSRSKYNIVGKLHLIYFEYKSEHINPTTYSNRYSFLLRFVWVFLHFFWWYRSLNFLFFVVLFLNLRDIPLLLIFLFCSFVFYTFFVDWFNDLFCFFFLHRFGLIPHDFVLFFLFEEILYIDSVNMNFIK